MSHRFFPPKACENQVIYQLAEVVLNCAGIDKYTDGNQRVESKVKDLVTEEGDDPSCMLLKSKKIITHQPQITTEGYMSFCTEI